jgi:two-component system sensor kinase FixL
MDGTDQKAADDTLRLAQEEPERNFRLTWLGELSDSIAHEVVQPPGAAISSAEAAPRWLPREPPDVTAALRSIERIQEAAFTAIRTFTGVRALSASVPMESPELSVNAVVEEAPQLSKPLLTHAGIRVDVSFNPANPTLHGDPNQLSQVLLNLIRNAVDSLKVARGRERSLAVGTSHKADEIRFELEDSGVGLSDEVTDWLFNTSRPKKRMVWDLG